MKEPYEAVPDYANRPPLDPRKLEGMGAGLVLAAFSSVEWIQARLGCTRAEAAQFKANAALDFQHVTNQARIARST